jgi:hypothetical protein
LPYHDEQLAAKVVSKDIHEEFKKFNEKNKLMKYTKRIQNCSKFEQGVVNNVGIPKN